MPSENNHQRFLEAIDPFGCTNDQRFAGLVKVLLLYGKLDEVSEMIEKHNAYMAPWEESVYANKEIEILPFFPDEWVEGAETLSFVPGEVSACDEESYNHQTTTKENDNGN